MNGLEKSDIGSSERASQAVLDPLYKEINRWQTRVVLLRPGKHDDPLVADLVVADIVHLPGLVLHRRQQFIEYEAISYAWGELVFDHRIEINGQDVPITRTLHGALRRFRRTVHTRPLWVDALSICQWRAREKSFQVQNMFTIFRKAVVVLVWLGETAEHTGEAVKLLHLEGNFVNIGAFGSSLSSEVRSGMLDLCSRPWISRAWIQQEIFAAQNVGIYCGEHRMTLVQFKAAARTAQFPDGLADPRIARNLTVLPHLRQATEVDLSRLGEQRGLQSKGIAGPQSKGIAGPQSRGICRHIRRSGSTTPQLKGDVCCTRPECVIADLKGVLATDPKDRVYALLGLTDCQTSYPDDTISPEPPFVSIDYSLTISKVFQCLTKCIMNRDGALDLLALHERSRAKDLRLPSWTPDWREWQWHRGDLERKHKAHEQMSFPRERLQLQTPDEWDVLRIQGRVYGMFSARFGDLLKLVDREPSAHDDKPLTAYFRDVGGPAGLRITGPIPTEEALEAITKFDSGEDPSHTGSKVNRGDLLVQGPGEVRPLMIVLRPRKKGGYKFVESIASVINAEAWERFKREAEFGLPREFVLW